MKVYKNMIIYAKQSNDKVYLTLNKQVDYETLQLLVQDAQSKQFHPTNLTSTDVDIRVAKNLKKEAEFYFGLDYAKNKKLRGIVEKLLEGFQGKGRDILGEAFGLTGYPLGVSECKTYLANNYNKNGHGKFTMMCATSGNSCQVISTTEVECDSDDENGTEDNLQTGGYPIVVDIMEDGECKLQNAWMDDKSVYQWNGSTLTKK